MVESAHLERSQPAVGITEPAARAENSGRLVSLDVFRGTVMALMLDEALRLPEVARSFPHSTLWALIAFNTEHVEWQGCSLHDLIQPAFSFLVGAALPFSIASRKMKGQSFGRMIRHAAWRALLLILLGIFLRSQWSRQTYFTFEDTLTQIGLGYAFLFLLGFTRVRTQVVVLVLILICFWAAFALYPAPGPHFDYTRVGVPQSWEHNYTGFLSHWNKNSNLSWAFDVWFLNLFSREKPFVFNEGGCAQFYSNAWDNDPGAADGRMAQEQSIEGAEAARPRHRGGRPVAPGSCLPMGRDLPDREKGLDVSVHALQRRLGGADPGRTLCADRMERMAALGISTGCNRDELDCHLCDELDDVGFLSEGPGYPPRLGDIESGATDLPACCVRGRNHIDLLVNPVLDVPPQDFSQDLRLCSKMP